MGSINKIGSTENGGASSTSALPAAAPSQVKPSDSSLDLDSAFKYLQNNGDIDTSSVDLNRVRRKIDLRLLPLMFLCFGIQFLDKVAINYAAVMGFIQDLKLKGNEFSNATTAFYIAYLIAELPNGYLLQKVPKGKWLGIFVMTGGIATACTAATTNYTNLIVARVFLAIFESVGVPSLMLITSQWYTRKEQSVRFCLWYCAPGIAQILGSLMSFALQHVRHADLAAWRIMFIVLGAVTMLIGALAGWILPDAPMSAKWLSEAEKVAWLNHVSGNRTGIKNRRFKGSQVLDLLLDVQLWLMTLIIVLVTISSGVTASYSTTLIRSFGYSSEIASLLNAPSGLVSLVSDLTVGYGVRLVPDGHRWAWLSACCVPGIIGSALMSFASSHAARLAGIYLVYSIPATVVVASQWGMANIAGHTKRAFGSAILAGSFSVGSIIGPQTFRSKDAPDYHPAKITLLSAMSTAVVVTFVLFGYYVWANRQKEKRMENVVKEGGEINSLEDTWGNLTDKENVEFRYVY